MNEYEDYEKISEEQVESALIGILRYGESVDDTELEGVENAVSFQEDGVLSYNRGVVIRMADGTEFQITIVRSR
ncbi:MAG: hypothetical protein LUH18_09330 [Oscillospiraceae bacterium]|nr:hypothetical protein [Oscillospiraceae bacterium]